MYQLCGKKSPLSSAGKVFSDDPKTQRTKQGLQVSLIATWDVEMGLSGGLLENLEYIKKVSRVRGFH